MHLSSLDCIDGHRDGYWSYWSVRLVNSGPNVLSHVSLGSSRVTDLNVLSSHDTVSLKQGAFTLGTVCKSEHSISENGRVRAA